MQNLYVKYVIKADKKGLKPKTEVYRKAPKSIDSVKYILEEIHTKNIHQLIKDEIVKIHFFIIIPLCPTPKFFFSLYVTRGNRRYFCF